MVRLPLARAARAGSVCPSWVRVPARASTPLGENESAGAEPARESCVMKEGIMAAFKLKPGVVTGSALDELFAYCRDAECSLPAVNVVGSHMANAALEAARQAKAPIIVQLSHSGAQFFVGKQLDN